MVIKVLFVISFICHSIRFHLVLFFLQLSSDRRTVSGSNVDILPTDLPSPPPAPFSIRTSGEVAGGLILLPVSIFTFISC